jgi:hypothetical protein
MLQWHRKNESNQVKDVVILSKEGKSRTPKLNLKYFIQHLNFGYNHLITTTSSYFVKLNSY